MSVIRTNTVIGSVLVNHSPIVLRGLIIDTFILDVSVPGTLMLGTGISQLCPDSVMTSNDVSHTCEGFFSGEVTDVNIWSRRLSLQELKEFTECHAEGQGADLLDWGEARWLFREVSYQSRGFTCMR